MDKTSSQRADWKADITVALHFAVSSGNLPAVKLLVETGSADVNAGTQEYHGSDGSMLLSHEDKTILFTPICLAVEQSHREIAAYLIQKGAKLAGHDRAGRQVLASAVATREIEMVGLMLDHDAALEATDNKGRTALHEAASRGLTDITALLISKGAQP
jgi:ankyrin repeat protein